MNSASELSKFKLYFEDLHEPSYWRRLIRRTTANLMREHIRRPLGRVTLSMPALTRRRK